MRAEDQAVPAHDSELLRRHTADLREDSPRAAQLQREGGRPGRVGLAAGMHAHLLLSSSCEALRATTMPNPA